MKSAVKAMVIKASVITLCASMALFGLISSIVIFSESILIIQKLNYTQIEEYGIVLAIGFVLMWLMTLVTDSVEHIIKTGFEKANKLLTKGENNE
tara:strand:- start:105 stop:389 length:285 start_codon:yes stop_codon:yes gene_type:complete